MRSALLWPSERFGVQLLVITVDGFEPYSVLDTLSRKQLIAYITPSFQGFFTRDP